MYKRPCGIYYSFMLISHKTSCRD